jgi:hypothetical protein
MIEVAIEVGGAANLALAATRLAAIRMIRAGTAPVRLRWHAKDVTAASLAFVAIRQAFVPLAFGLLSLIYAEQFASTPLGVGLSLVIGLNLLLRLAECALVPELRVVRPFLEGGLSLLGAIAYLLAVASGI